MSAIDRYLTGLRESEFMSKMYCQIPGRHVVFRKERNLQNFCAGDDNFLACCSDGFSCDAVNLVESVRPQIAVIRCPDKHLQIYRLLIVANKLLGEMSHNQHLYSSLIIESHIKNTKPQLKLIDILIVHTVRILQQLFKSK